MAVTGDAGPLCTGPVGSTGRRRSRPLRSRIKPGSTSSTITSLIGVDHTTIFPAEGGCSSPAGEVYTHDKDTGTSRSGGA